MTVSKGENGFIGSKSCPLQIMPLVVACAGATDNDSVPVWVALRCRVYGIRSYFLPRATAKH
jgi:hypothetical protein